MQSKKKIKVLLCSPPPYMSGGIPRWTEHILNYYDTLEVKQIDLKFFPMARKLFVAYVSTLKRLYYGIVDYWDVYKQYKQTIKIEKPDIIHLVSSASIGLIKDVMMIKASIRNNIRIVVHFRFGRIPELCKKGNWEYKLLCRVINLADKVILIDNQSYEALKKRGFANILLLPNPLSPSVTKYVEANMNSLIKEERKIVFVGQVLETKGVFELLKACNSITDIKLKMLGYVNEEMKNKLLNSLEGDKSWIEICGNQDYDIVLQEMLTAGVFVLPTYTEGFPNVILESMACGSPIVATNVGAIPEMLDIENGFQNGICIKPKDVEVLKEAILKMLDDREYALKCGRNAQKRVNSEYSMTQVWNKLENIWLSEFLY